jgi:hypothetical protein
VNFFFELKEEAERTGNKGLRALAKLLLNSLWGKLGQRSYPTCEWVTHGERLKYLMEKFETGEWELDRFDQREPLRMWFNYRKKDDCENRGTTAPHVAAFVSMWGRVMLHRKLLHPHGQRALYCDTDSAILYLRGGDADDAERLAPFRGDAIGRLTDEVKKIVADQGHDLGTYRDPQIREVVCVAPKTYALRIVNEDPPLTVYKTVCKGFEPSFKNAMQINFASMKELVWAHNGLKEHVNRTRPLTEGEERQDVRRRRIHDSGRLQFVSSLSRNEIAPMQRTIAKVLSGVYTKGRTVRHEPRLVQPFGEFDAPGDTFLSFEDVRKHYD